MIHVLLVLKIGMSRRPMSTKSILCTLTTVISKMVCIFRTDYENFVRDLSKHLVQESERVDTYMASTIQVRLSSNKHHSCQIHKLYIYKKN